MYLGDHFLQKLYECLTLCCTPETNRVPPATVTERANKSKAAVLVVTHIR